MGLIGFAATQINLLVNTILASGTVVGAVSWLSYAFRLFQLPVGILSVSIGNSNLVHFSQAWKSGESDRAKDLLQSSYFLSILLVLAPMVGIFAYADEIVNVIFERGKFSADSTLMTAKALRWYAVGLPFYGTYKIFVPTFYAIGRQKVPVYSSIFAIGVNIVFCVTMTPIYGFEILALGTSISMFLNSTIQTLFLKRDLELKLSAFYNFRLLKASLAAFLTFACCYYLKTIIPFHNETFLIRAVSLVAQLAIVVAMFGLLSFIFGERAAVVQVVSKLKSKFVKKV